LTAGIMSVTAVVCVDNSARSQCCRLHCECQWQ